MVKLIVSKPEVLLAELNKVVAQHNQMAVDFMRCLILLSRQLAVRRAEIRQFDELMAENSRLLGLAQRVLDLQDENDHLYYVIGELDRRLRTYEQ